MKKRKTLIVVLIIIICVRIGGWYLFENTERICASDNVITSELSPGLNYEAKAYLIENGATVGDSVLVQIIDNRGKLKNIYWNYPCNKAEIKWKSSKIIEINSIELNVEKDVYDWRKTSSDSKVINIMFVILMCFLVNLLLIDMKQKYTSSKNCGS